MSPCLSLLSVIHYGNSLLCGVFACSTARAGCDAQVGGAIIDDSVVIRWDTSAAINAPSAIAARNSVGSARPADIGLRATAQLFGNGVE